MYPITKTLYPKPSEFHTLWAYEDVRRMFFLDAVLGGYLEVSTVSASIADGAPAGTLPWIDITVELKTPDGRIYTLATSLYEIEFGKAHPFYRLMLYLLKMHGMSSTPRYRKIWTDIVEVMPTINIPNRQLVVNGHATKGVEFARISLMQEYKLSDALMMRLLQIKPDEFCIIYELLQSQKMTESDIESLIS